MPYPQVEEMLDEILTQSHAIVSPKMLHSEAIPLHIAAARRGPLFITVTCKIVKYLDKKSHALLFELAEDEKSDDTTVNDYRMLLVTTCI